MVARVTRRDIGRYWKKTRDFLKDDSSVLSWIANLVIAFIVIKFILYPLLGFLFGAGLPVVAVVSSSMDHDAVDGSVCGVQVSDDYSGSLDAYWNVCGGWYESRGIPLEEFSEFSFRNGFKKGDIMVILGPSRSAPQLGDVLVFEAQQQYPIIHRIVSIVETPQGMVYATKGDHNPAQISEYVLVNEFGTAYRCERGGVPMPCGLGVLVTNETPNAVRIVDETIIAEEAVIGKAVLRIPLLGWVKIWFTDAAVWLLGVVR